MKVRWIGFYPDEWLAGTLNVSIYDRGIYITICALIYSRGGPISQELLRRHTGEHGHAINASLARLIKAGKISQKGGEIVQERCANELETVQKRSRKLSESGTKGNEIKKLRAATRSLNGHATTTTTTTTIKASPDGEALPPVVPPSPIKRGVRLPADWCLDPEDRQYAQSKGLDPDETAEGFRDFWHAKAGLAATKLDWHAAWRSWCRKEPIRRPSQAPGGSPHDLLWRAAHRVSQS